MVGLFIDKLVDPLLIVATPLWLHDKCMNGGVELFQPESKQCHPSTQLHL